MQKILKKIKPNPKEVRDTTLIVKEFLKKLNGKLVRAEAVVGGSFGKGTWLNGNHDVDIFVRFDDDTDCSDILELILKRIFRKVERIHGSRDYFQINYKKLNFEIVPVLKIKKAEEANNVTDVSILHVEWVNKKTNTKLKDEIRIAKQFFKAAKVYGAETFVRGFSGYVVELLTIYYGGFDKLLKGILKWKPGHVINPAKREFDLNSDKLSCLVIIDPVQPNRNAGAAISIDKFEKLIKYTQGYLKKPSDKLFEIKKISLKDLKHDLIITGEALKGKKDVIGTKLLKAYEFIYFNLEKEGFGVRNSGWEWNDKFYFWFDVKNKEIEREYFRVGPPLDKKEDVLGFRKKHTGKQIIEKNKRLHVKLAREEVKYDKFVAKLLKNEEVKKRVKSAKLINRKVYK